MEDIHLINPSFTQLSLTQNGPEQLKAAGLIEQISIGRWHTEEKQWVGDVIVVKWSKFGGSLMEVDDQNHESDNHLALLRILGMEDTAPDELIEALIKLAYTDVSNAETNA